jgi:hypothetical protein
MNGILSTLQGSLGNTGLNPAESQALNNIAGNAQGVSRFVPAINKSTASLLAGGGALNQAPAVQAAFNQYGANTNPLANNTDYNPYNTPGFADALKTMNSDITNQINGQFAAAGRDFSGANSQALARGLSQGDAQAIAAQYNQNVQNQQAAAQNIYNAGNTNAGILSGLQQQYLTNQQAGVNQVPTGLNSANAGANAIWNAQVGAQQLPLQNLGLLSSIGIPIAGLGGQSSGTSNTTSTASPIQDFMGIMSGIGSVMPRAPIKYG